MENMWVLSSPQDVVHFYKESAIDNPLTYLGI